MPEPVRKTKEKGNHIVPTHESTESKLRTRSIELLDIFDISKAVAYAMAVDEKDGRIVIDEERKVITVLPNTMHGGGEE